MRLTENELSIIRAYFRTKPVLKAWLFGSYARGEANATSDVDLLVNIDYQKLDVFDYLDWPTQLADSLRKKIDLGSDKYVLRFYQSFIEADKQLIYER